MADIANIGFRADTAELKDAKASLEALGPAAKTAETAVDKVAKATDGAATAAAKGTAAVKAEATALATGAANANNMAAATAKAAAANTNLATTATKATGAVNSLQGQVGNISAQLGDITVQLAGGQSPFQIALQQGFQLIGVFGNNGLGAVLKGLGGAFLSLVSPLSLITIGVITLGGYVVQYLTSWLTQGSEANLKISEQQDLIRGLADAWGTGIPAIDAYIAKINEAKTAADALAATKILRREMVDPTTQAVEALNVEFADLTSKLQLAGAEYETINTLNTAFQNLRDKVAEGKATQEDFNAVLAAAEAAGATGVSGIDTFIAALNKLGAKAVVVTGQIATMNAQMAQAQNAALNNPAYFRSAGMNGQTTDGPIEYGSADGFTPLPAVGPTFGNRGTPELSGFPWENFGGGGSGRKASGGGGGAAKVQTELQKIAEGFQKLSEPFNQAKSAYSALDGAMKNGVIGNEEYATSLETIRTAFMAAGGDAEQWAKITADSTKKVSDATKEAKDITKGFISDLRSGLKNGEGFFEAFKNAALNALDKITDKLLDSAIDGLFSGGGGGGGFFGGIGKFITGLFSAKGNAFDGGKAMAFANGGSFTNGVVSRPTAFNLGVMGEAGPEAIVPLSRGPDGSLGVSMHSANGGGARGNVTLAPVTENTFVLSGAISSAEVQAQIQSAAEKTQKETQKNMVGWLQQYQADGAFA